MTYEIIKKIKIHTNNWLNVIENGNWPDGAVSINFGLFEWENTGFDVYIAFCKSFNENNLDLFCDELDPVEFRYANTPNNKGILDWTEFENIIGSCVKTWADKMVEFNKMKNIKAIAHGFDSGDLTIVYRK